MSDSDISHSPQWQSQKLQALGQLAGGVAHDFNNILSIIEGYARMLERHMTLTDPAHDKIQHILTATKRGAGLTRQLLAFGRQQILPLTECDLVKLVRETQILLRPLVSPKIHLYINTPEDPIYIPCDPDVIVQILINLAINARDALPENGGGIWIDVATTAQRALLIVADNGAGMHSDIAARVFDPFFTTKDQGKGTGLGLSMIAGYMQQIGGSISLDTNPGEGSSFSLSFPRQRNGFKILPKQNVVPPYQTQSMPQDISLAKKTILVVDDEEALLPVLEHQLYDMGLTVLKAANADSALLLQRQYPDTIDLLLTDVVMPGISSVKLAEMLQQMRPETGIVYMTGYPDRGSEFGYGGELPPDALVLHKPLPLDELSPTLKKALARLCTPDES